MPAFASAIDPHDSHGELIDGLAWPDEPDITALGEAIAASKDLKLVLRAIPAHIYHPEVSGLTIITGKTARVFYDTTMPLLNQAQTILHEYAHILHEDVTSDSDCTLRSTFSNPVEMRAETTGMHLLRELRRRSRSTPGGPSEVLGFLSGSEDCSD